jgi:hypothetical protein
VLEDLRENLNFNTYTRIENKENEMQDCTQDIRTMMALTSRKKNSTPGSLWGPEPAMIARMPAPVDTMTGEMIRQTTLFDVPDLNNEDAARKLIEKQHAA